MVGNEADFEGESFSAADLRMLAILPTIEF